jgi:hydrogenase-4 transcriptional activator
MATPGGVIGPEHLSSELTAEAPAAPGASRAHASRPVLRGGQTLASVVDDLERDLIRETLSRQRGNISESARALGLTRRGLYLKLRRLGLEPAPELNTK